MNGQRSKDTSNSTSATNKTIPGNLTPTTSERHLNVAGTAETPPSLNVNQPEKEAIKEYLKKYPRLLGLLNGVNRTMVRPVRAVFNGNSRRIRSSVPKIKKYYNRHLGERCFVIGNGPSLLASDLDKLANEKAFAANRINSMFDKTAWRPTYYCAVDYDMLQEMSDTISDGIEVIKFICLALPLKYKPVNDALFIKLLEDTPYPNLPRFSEDITKGLESGNTVTYVSIQIAAYMGFKEIHLLGVDHNYSINLNPDGTISRDDSVKDYFDQTTKPISLPQLQKTTLSYQSAKQYADAHGIKIYNATRGGKLEVFERVNFDNLFTR